MVHRLGLSKHLNQNIQGKASGVGATSIVGLLENVVCLINYVEFRLYFLVLDSNDPWLILGLDLMRRYKCVVDLEKNVLVFGGREGVEVPFLDAEMAGEAAARKIMAADSVMTQASSSATTSQVNAATQGGDMTRAKKSGLRKFFKK